MEASTFEGGCWPTRQQELMLQAALLPGPRGLDAWRQWHAGVDIDLLDLGSQRLLPLLYHSLRSQGVKDAVIERFKGYYRRTWYQNQLLFHSTASLLRAFHQEGIRTLLLKGAALTMRYYGDAGLRPMDDADVLVPQEQARTAIDLLQRLGWRPEGRGPGRHAWGFKGPDGWQVDLHWHVLQDSSTDGASQTFWADAVAVRLLNVPTLALSPADQLLHVCVHGLRWTSVPPLRWIADATMVLQVSRNEMNWSRLVAQAEQRRLVLPVRQALGYLQRTLGVPVPDGVLTDLNRAVVSFADLVSYEARVYRKLPLGQRWRLWRKYLGPKTGTPLRKLIDVTKYLQRRWNVPAWRLPMSALMHAARRLTGRITARRP